MKQTLLKGKTLIAAALLLLTTTAFAQLPNVLIAACPATSTWNGDVKVKLVSTGQFSNVDIYDISTGTPTLAQLMMYDAVFVYTDASPMNANAFGDTLAAYIDAGGGVVNCVFSTAGINIGGAFNTASYQVIVPGSQTQNVQLTLGTVLLPSHPLMQGVTSFNGGTSSYHSTSTTLATGAYRVANWSDGSFLITARNNVGLMGVNRVDLDFFPPSDSVRTDFWVDSTNGALIMANALTYVSNSTNGIAHYSSDLSMHLFPNPTNSTVHLVPGVALNTMLVQIMDLAGRVVYTAQFKDVQKEQDLLIDLSSYDNGLYSIRVSSDKAAHVEKLSLMK